MNDNKYLLHIDNVSLGYGDHTVLSKLSLQVSAGEIISIIGPNGSGKSTLLKSIIGQLNLLDGVIYLDNADIRKLDGSTRAKSISAMMTEHVRPELMTCYDIVAMGRYPYTGRMGLLRDSDRAIIDSAIDTVGARELADTSFDELSDGQRQRVLLARCIAQEPRLIILDEPTSYLDIRYKIELLGILSKLRDEKNISVIMSLHELDMARQVSDRVICIGYNGVDYIGTPEQAFSPEYISRLFDIDIDVYRSFWGIGETTERTSIYRNQKKLRLGITTGSCAAAAAQACAQYIANDIVMNQVNLLTPSGSMIRVDVHHKGNGIFGVIKDSGDDPDVTNGTEIVVSISTVSVTSEEARANRWFVDENYPGIYLTGGCGIGTVTKEGLEQEIGYSAINKVPRQMIMSAVYDICGDGNRLLVEISAPDGARLAEKTFNPMLGIEGGISVLGTSGILEPMSEKSIVDTIETIIKQKSVQGKKAILVTPGHYGQGYVSDYLGLSLEDSVKSSNYIGETIDLAVSYGFERMLLVGNLGKLVKLAAGIMNTHSKVADGRMETMCTHAALCGADKALLEKLYQCINTDSALTLLSEQALLEPVCRSIIDAIDRHVSHRAGERLDVGVVVFSEKYGFLGQTDNAEEIIKWFIS